MYDFQISDNIIKKINHICSNLYNELLYLYPNVVGIAQGVKIINGFESNSPCLSFLVSKKIAKDQLAKSDIIPSTIYDIVTDVIEVGEIKSHSKYAPICRRNFCCNKNLTINPMCNCNLTARENNIARYRPLIGGIACSVSDVPFIGTLGCAVRDADNVYMLSTNHTIANLNQAPIGSLIHQPYHSLNPCLNTSIASLYSFKELNLGSASTDNPNRIDAAIGYIGKVNDICIYNEIAGGILSIGSINGISSNLNIGDTVKKVGQSSGLTTGKITHINATIIVSYDPNNPLNKDSAKFTGQTITTSMSKFGDSGSIGLDNSNNAFGLLYSSSDVASFYCPISEVLSNFNVSFF